MNYITKASTAVGRFLRVKTLDSSDGTKKVIVCCDGGDITFQHNMTATDARELAGYLQEAANECEESTAVDWSAA